MGDPMLSFILNFYRPIVSLGVLLLLTLSGTLRAAESTAKEESTVPVGYEDAAEPPERKPKKKTLKKSLKKKGPAKKNEPKAIEEKKKERADVPAGYGDADQAGKPQKTRRPVAVPAKLRVAKDAKAIGKEKKKVENNPQLKALVVQMRGQLKPYFAGELTFAKTVCEPDAKQLKNMKSLATPALEQALRSLAIQQGGQMGWGGAFGRNQNKQADILDDFELAAGQIVSQVFPPETVASYQEEQGHRKVFRARAGAMALVANLDGKFHLAKPQRKALTDSLQKVWQRSWQRYMQIMGHNPQFFPPVPDKAVVPHLNAAQVKQWKSMQRQSIGFHWQNLNINHGLFRNMKQEVEWFKEPVEKEIAEAGGFVQALVEGDVAFVIEAVGNEKEEEEEK